MRRSFSVYGVLGLALAVSSAPLVAASHTWSGASSGTWSTAGNWSAGGPPTNGESNVVLVFPSAQQNMSSMVNDLTGLNVTSITLADANYNATGNSINLNGPIAATPGPVTGAAVLGFPIALTGPATFTSDGGFYNVLLNGAISGAQPITITCVNGAGGNVLFGGTNTFTSTVNVASGYLVLLNSSALGAGDGTPATGTTVSSGATLQISGGTYANEALTIGGLGANSNGALQSGSGSPNIWNGPVTLTSNAQFVAIAGQPITFNGTISGAFTLIARTESGMTLTGNNTISGLTIEYGSVYVNGNMAGVPVSLGGASGNLSAVVLGGTGTVGPVTTLNSNQKKRTVDAGAAGATGILTTGGLNLHDGAQVQLGTLAARLAGTTAGTGYDQVKVNGTVDVSGGATLEVTFGYTPVVGDTFTIVDNDGSDAVVGTFAGLPQGATFFAGGRTLQISYTGGTGNDITLTVTSLTPVELQGFDAD